MARSGARARRGIYRSSASGTCALSRRARIERLPGPAGDLYSLGLVLHECLTGRPALPGPGVGDILRQQIAAVIPDVRLLGVTAPRALVEVLQRLLRKDPDDRYQSAAAVLADLDAIEDALEHGVEDPDLVIGRRDVRSTLTEPGLVGVQDVLTRLDRELAAAGEGRGRLALIGAESGGGKTRLLEELVTRAKLRGAWIVRGQGLSRAPARPLEILSGVARNIVAEVHARPALGERLCARLGDRRKDVLSALPELAAVLGPAGEAAPGPDALGEERTLSALVALFDALGTREVPAIVALDDAQWADGLALKLIARWARSPPDGGRHVAIVAASRTDEAPLGPALRDAAAVEVTLPKLRERNLRALGESMAGPLPELAVGVVVRLSDGNPFFAAAVLHGMVEVGALWPAGGERAVDERALAEMPVLRQGGGAARSPLRPPPRRAARPPLDGGRPGQELRPRPPRGRRGARSRARARGAGSGPASPPRLAGSRRRPPVRAGPRPPARGAARAPRPRAAPRAPPRRRRAARGPRRRARLRCRLSLRRRGGARARAPLRPRRRGARPFPPRPRHGRAPVPHRRARRPRGRARGAGAALRRPRRRPLAPGEVRRGRGGLRGLPRARLRRRGASAGREQARRAGLQARADRRGGGANRARAALARRGGPAHPRGLRLRPRPGGAGAGGPPPLPAPLRRPPPAPDPGRAAPRPPAPYPAGVLLLFPRQHPGPLGAPPRDEPRRALPPDAQSRPGVRPPWRRDGLVPVDLARAPLLEQEPRHLPQPGRALGPGPGAAQPGGDPLRRVALPASDRDLPGGARAARAGRRPLGVQRRPRGRGARPAALGRAPERRAARPAHAPDGVRESAMRTPRASPWKCGRAPPAATCPRICSARSSCAAAGT